MFERLTAAEAHDQSHRCGNHATTRERLFSVAAIHHNAHPVRVPSNPDLLRVQAAHGQLVLSHSALHTGQVDHQTIWIIQRKGLCVADGAVCNQPKH